MDLQVFDAFCRQFDLGHEIVMIIERNGNQRIVSIQLINKTRSVTMQLPIKSQCINTDRQQIILLRQSIDLRLERLFYDNAKLKLFDVQDHMGITLPNAFNRFAGDPFAKDEDEISQVDRLTFLIKRK